MEVAVIGGGALGLMWCARLMHSSFTPTLIVRTEEQQRLLREHGLTYIENGQKHVLFPDVETYSSFKGDLPLISVLAVKQTHLSSLIPFFQEHVQQASYIFTLQNGLGHYELLTNFFASDHIVLGSTSEGALRHNSTTVERTGFGNNWFGIYDYEQSPKPIDSVLQKLQQHGFSITWDPHIMFRLWRKCVINSVINPLTALLQIENGKLLHSESTLNVMKKLFEEACAVAKLHGFTFHDDLWQEILDICRNTSRNRSSMLQDILANRKTEIQFINGFIVRVGQQFGVHIPYQQCMVELIHAREDLNQTLII